MCKYCFVTKRYSYVTGEGSGNDSGESARTPLTEEEKIEQVKRSVNTTETPSIVAIICDLVLT